MKTSDVRALSADQINDEILKLKKEQFNLRFQRATGQLEKTTRFKEVRRTIAQLLTVANERAQGKEVVARAPKAPKPKAPKAEKPAKAEAAGEEAAPKAKKETKAKAEPKAKTETKTATKKSAKKAED